MRKISFESAQALMSHRTYNGGNTKVVKFGDEYTLELHGNPIASVNGTGVLSITSANWFTATTKERLNALPGVHIQQKAGTWYLNGNVWDGKWTLIDTSK